MFSSARKAQVEPLPALLALAVFAIGLSLYGVTLDGLPMGSDPTISDATMDIAVGTLSEGPVVLPGRIDQVPNELPDGIEVTLRAGDQTWQAGTADDGNSSRPRQVLVRTERGEVPGVLRVTT